MDTTPTDATRSPSRSYPLRTPPPGDAIPLRVAAPMVDREVRTLRGWLRTGALRGYLEEGADPRNAPVLVSMGELRVLAASLAAAPGRPPRGEREEPAPPVPASGSASPEVDALRAELDAERLRGLRERVSAAEARAATAERQADTLREATAEVAATLRARVVDLERERDELRGRVQALEAEGEALRVLAGVPWYRRLLGVRPSLPG